MPEPDPRQYDSFAAGFEAHAEDGPYNAMYDRPAMLELVGDVTGKQVLDAACGPGLYAEALLARGAEVIGCDASPRMIERAAARAGDRAVLRVHDLEQPFDWLEDESIDIVLIALALHHLTDRLGFLREMRRVLRADGVLVVSTHHPLSDWHCFGGSYFTTEPVTEVWSKGWEITAWRMPLTLMCEEFHQAGFLIERLVEPLPLPELADADPEEYEHLNEIPSFIMFRLVKG